VGVIVIGYVRHIRKNSYLTIHVCIFITYLIDRYGDVVEGVGWTVVSAETYRDEPVRFDLWNVGRTMSLKLDVIGIPLERFLKVFNWEHVIFEYE
jgi:hypothetical protein